MFLCKGRTFHARKSAITKFILKGNVLQDWLEVIRGQIMWELIVMTLIHYDQSCNLTIIERLFWIWSSSQKEDREAQTRYEMLKIF